MTRRLAALVCASTLACGTAAAQPSPADTASRLLALARLPGVTGHEAAVRDAVRAALPPWARPDIDNLGTLSVTVGSGDPRSLVIAPLDETGYYVSRITDDGYLRLHRPVARPRHALDDQFHVGQPVVVETGKGTRLQGVTAVRSSHLNAAVPPEELARVAGLDDLYVDVGASTRTEVEALGIRVLDAVTLRERAQPLAGGRVAGTAVQGRAAALALVDVLAGQPKPPATHGTVVFAWAAQTAFTPRGLARLNARFSPTRTLRILPLRAAAADRIDPFRGLVVAAGDTAAADAALALHLPVQPVARELLDTARPDPSVSLVALPARYPQTPVETVAAADIDALARLVAAFAGVPSGPGRAIVAGVAPPVNEVTSTAPLVSTLKALIETSGVSGHEAAVREQVRERLPASVTADVDASGNLVVSMGQGAPHVMVVAHMDEVGLEVAGVGDDGRATVRVRGGMFLSLMEAHPVLVHTAKGPVPAVVAPRADYATANMSPPDIGALFVDVGTTTRAGTEALGVAVGQAVTVRKVLAPLAGGPRYTARSMDDRVGSAALLRALARMSPATLTHRVSFVWSVEEEIGLNGARAAADRLRPDLAIAIDTFVSTDAPLDNRRFAYAPLGRGPVLRGMDNSTLTPTDVMDRIIAIARMTGVPLQIGATAGGTDASAASASGAVDVALSWPGRYSHSPVEVMDLRDAEFLVRLIASVATQWK